MNFRAWLKNEISGDYGDLIGGWKGGAKGPFDDPKRMSQDPLFWRNHQFKQDQSTEKLNQAKKNLHQNPTSKHREKYNQAVMQSIWDAPPTVPEAKPRGEYQGWTNWDTWATALWISNGQESLEATRKKSATFIQKYSLKHKKAIDAMVGDEDQTVDFDFVNWEEISKNQNQD